MAKRLPDVIVLDLQMPRMDGFTFLKRIMSTRPLPVVICSSAAARGSDTAMRALEEGAIDIIAKPAIGVREFLADSSVLIGDVLRGAAQSRMRRKPRMLVTPRISADAVVPQRAVIATPSSSKIVAIGASTGGTEALREIIESLPADAPGTVIVQHMPEGFTAAFAKRLNSIARVEVKEAESGDVISAGRVLIAPGNKHLVVHRNGTRFHAEVKEGPLVSRHRPSVDVLFRSVAQAAGANATGVILTGMGDDGANGLAEMRAAGALTIAQDEATCVIFGMPKEAIARGAAGSVLPLQQIAAAIGK